MGIVLPYCPLPFLCLPLELSQQDLR